MDLLGLIVSVAVMVFVPNRTGGVDQHHSEGPDHTRIPKQPSKGGNGKKRWKALQLEHTKARILRWSIAGWWLEWEISESLLTGKFFQIYLIVPSLADY